MARYGKPSGRDIDEHILQRLDALEAQVKVARGAGLRSAIDRGNTAAIPEPVEGQTMIQHDTGAPKYYADGAWHSFSGGGSSGLTAGFANHGQYSHSYGSRNTIIFNDFWTNDATNFSYTDLVTDPQFSRANGALTYIQIVTPGLYEILFQTNDSWPSATYLEPSCDSGAGFDTLLSYLNNQMFDTTSAHSDAFSTATGTSKQFHGRFIADITSGDMPSGYLKIGFNTRCGGTGTCTWSGMLGVTLLGANLTETWLGP